MAELSRTIGRAAKGVRGDLCSVILLIAAPFLCGVGLLAI